MYGLESISAHNGWAISFVGVTIVFTGLTLLSLSISQLHKILDLLDNKGKSTDKVHPKTIAPVEKKTECKPDICVDDLETIRQYKMIIDRLGQPFSLPKLLYLAMKIGLDRPHSTINKLLVKKVIVSDGKGYFKWTL